MGNKERLMVDMDDVICGDGFLYMINSYLETNYTYDDFNGYYMQDIIPNKKIFFEWFKTQNMYDYCKIIPGCYEVMEELNKEYDLFIGTSFIWKDIVDESGFILGHKFNFLKEKLPFISPYQYIFLSDKNVLNMDIKLDDRVDNLEGARTKLLFSAYHNMGICDDKLNTMGIERMNGWYDVKKRLLRK